MLKILINDQSVDLEGVQFNLQLNSPIPFVPDDGQVEGSFAFGVTFPATPRNKKIFGFPHRLESYPEGDLDYPGLLFFQGRLLFKIMITLTESSDFSYRGNIKVDLGYYTSQIGEKTLRNLVYEGDILLGTTTQDVVDHANDVAAKNYPEVNYNFPEVYNPLFYGEENKLNDTYQGFVNFYVHGTGFRANSVDSDHDVNNYYNLCPFLYLFYVLQKCYEEFGYKVTGSVLKDSELSQLLIYNNYALDLQEDRYKFIAELSADQAIPAAETMLEFDEVIVNIDDCYDDLFFKYLIKKGGYTRITGHFSVEATDIFGYGTTAKCMVALYKGATLVGYVIESAAIELPFTWEFDLDYTCSVETADIGEYLSLTIEFIKDPGVYQYNLPGTVFAESWWGAQNMTLSMLNIYAKTINLVNHVPDIKISTFLITLMKMFGIVSIYHDQRNEVDLCFLKDILASTAEDNFSNTTARSSKLVGFRETKSYKLNYAWASSDKFTEENFTAYDPQRLYGTYNTFVDLPTSGTEGYFAIIKNLNAVYRYVDGAWTWFSDLYYPLVLGNGVTPISFEASPLMMYDNRDNPAMPRVCPKISQEGSSYNLGMKDFGFHLVFFRGMQDDAAGNSYPFASTTIYSPTGTIIGYYEFNLDSAYGLYEIFLESYYNFIMNRSRPVDYDRQFTASEIQALNFIRKKRIFQHLFLLEEVSIPISNASIGVATMKLQKI